MSVQIQLNLLIITQNRFCLLISISFLKTWIYEETVWLNKLEDTKFISLGIFTNKQKKFGNKFQTKLSADECESINVPLYLCTQKHSTQICRREIKIWENCLWIELFFIRNRILGCENSVQLKVQHHEEKLTRCDYRQKSFFLSTNIWSSYILSNVFSFGSVLSKILHRIKKKIATRKFEAMEPYPYEEKDKALDCGKVVN